MKPGAYGVCGHVRVITTPYPTPAATGRLSGISAKRYRELRAMVIEALARERKQSARKRPQQAWARHAECNRSLSLSPAAPAPPATQ
jgi:hypothetical protein